MSPFQTEARLCACKLIWIKMVWAAASSRIWCQCAYVPVESYPVSFQSGCELRSGFLQGLHEVLLDEWPELGRTLPGTDGLLQRHQTGHVAFLWHTGSHITGQPNSSTDWTCEAGGFKCGVFQRGGLDPVNDTGPHDCIYTKQRDVTNFRERTVRCGSLVNNHSQLLRIETQKTAYCTEPTWRVSLGGNEAKETKKSIIGCYQRNDEALCKF